MHRFHRSHIRIRQQGQTLIIALIVMGVLLILGLVFLGLINRNIRNAATSQRRSEASDLADAGVRYAHGQLVASGLGADWRGEPTIIVPGATADVTNDPDIYYIRPSSGLTLPNGQKDLGGPDGLGPFVRFPFPGGRSLTRVRYGATDANPTPLITSGPLRNPGAARAQLIIESVGRPGAINPKDPTTFNTQNALQFQNFANATALLDGISAMARFNGQFATSRKLTAFAPIGIIDFARFETNVFNSSSPIEMGIPSGLGATAFDDVTYNKGAGGIGSVDVSPRLASVTGTPGDLNVATSGLNALRGFGSMMFNGDVTFYGNNDVYLNRTLGDGIHVAGRVAGADGGRLNLYTVKFNPGATPPRYEYYDPATNVFLGTAAQTAPGITLTDGGTFSFDSQDPSFTTAGGLFLDGSSRTDLRGFASGVGTLVPPSILAIDPDTKVNRYVRMTRESGTIPSGEGNEGQYGHGAGVYVNNAADRQEPTDAAGRKIVGDQRSLFDDWLNPDAAAAGADSGWKGPFYVPSGAVVQLQAGGWAIQRDGTGPSDERTWKFPDGTDSRRNTIRYRVGVGTDGLVHVVNTLTFGAANLAKIDTNLSPSDYMAGQAFNGVLYFEGNVRVRGTIPTGVQMTLVSGATIYIEGSILKGTTNNDVTGGTRGASLTTLPTATLMLMAKDNVAVNTPNFFSPVATQALESTNDTSGATAISPVVLKAAGGTESGRLDFVTELPLDPTNPLNGAQLPSPAQWRPSVTRYRQWDAPSIGVPTQLLLGITMDDGTASASFLSMDLNEGSPSADSRYFFAADDGLITNSAAAYLGLGATATTELYGLGAEPWQRYSRFEMRSFPLVPNPNSTTFDPNTGVIGGLGYNMFSGSNNVLMRPGAIPSVSANNLLLGRAALAPGDVKIEASIFAEQGSFFVIPGPWFNPNPNDTHVAYAKRLKDLQGELSASDALYRANRERLEAYGAAPFVPFYGEPLDVKLSVVGSVAENLPPPISVQAQWIKKWSWIPRRLGSTLMAIPKQHVPNNFDPTNQNFVPNLQIQYDPVLATGRVNDPSTATPVTIRTDAIGRSLPPMPRLPVSPKLAYFGEL